MPYVFTKQGVAMIASALHTKIAVYVSAKITSLFVEQKRELLVLF